MSHELRTPLVGILGYSDLLSNIVENEEAKDMAEGINRTGQRLLSTLSLVLDLARVESDKFEVDISQIDIIKVIKETYQNFIAMAKNKNLDLILDIHTESFEFSTDVGMIKVIIENLVNNAIKFTKEGQITIRSKICNTNDTPNFCLQVSDTGVGIKKQDIPKIFEEFKQLSEGFTKDFQGSGLGLSITKKFVNLLGGIIEVESEPGKGSTFSIKFPLEIKAVA
jgi:signal transduction histidine kinase